MKSVSLETAMPADINALYQESRRVRYEKPTRCVRWKLFYVVVATMSPETSRIRFDKGPIFGPKMIQFRYD